MVYEIHDLFLEVVDITRDWKPRRRYRDEFGYRDDLTDFLRKKLSNKDNFWQTEGVGVRKEPKAGLVDIQVGKVVGIELKKDLTTKEQVDSTVGRVAADDYRQMIIVLVGRTNKDKFRMLEENLGTYKKNIRHVLRLEIVEKGFKRGKRVIHPKPFVG